MTPTQTKLESARWYLAQGDRGLYAANMVQIVKELHDALEDVRGAIRADRTEGMFSDLGVPSPVQEFEVAF